jgi:hypothetical protein
MRVIAIADGFCGGTLRRRGTVFELPDSLIKKDEKGKPVLPSWVMRVKGPEDEEDARAYVESDRYLEEKHFADGVRAASSKAKPQTFVEAMAEPKHE